MVNLNPINSWEDFEAMTGLEVHEEQKKFVETNEASFAEAYALWRFNDNEPYVLGIYDGDTPVGFTIFCYEIAQSNRNDRLGEPVYFLWHIMIDKNHQGKGYGKSALAQIIETVSKKPLGDANWFYTWIVPGCTAHKLYLNAGFVKTSGGEGGSDVILRLAL